MDHVTRTVSTAAISQRSKQSLQQNHGLHRCANVPAVASSRVCAVTLYCSETTVSLVIFMTQLCREARGASDYLAKPVDIDRLLQLLEKWL